MEGKPKPCRVCKTARAIQDYDAAMWRVECDCPIFLEYNSEIAAIAGWNQRLNGADPDNESDLTPEQMVEIPR